MSGRRRLGDFGSRENASKPGLGGDGKAGRTSWKDEARRLRGDGQARR